MTKIDKTLEAFKQAGFAFDITRFEDRLVAQKLVYLLQELGVQLGYEGTYNFYLRGTYSPTLTKDLFATAPSGSTVTLDPDEKQSITGLVESTKLRPHILEVMAAYRFLRQAGRDEEAAVRLLKTHKPFISPRDIGIAITKCKLIWSEVTDADREALRREMEPWERATAQDTDFA